MPRAGLTRDRVVEEAAVMADEVGLSQLTLAALAVRVGVRQPSLYKHIESMAGLRRSISLEAKTQLGDVLGRAAVGRSGGDAIRAMSGAYRSWAFAHPARYEASQWVPAPGDAEDELISLRAVQIIADVLVAYDLHGDDAIDAIRALRSMLHGFVSLEASGSFGLDVDIDRSFERLVRGFVGALAGWGEPSEGE
ncbi:WHG domain-containing protein [Subtercola sp. RTI3]|nr:WHG domain-containing protein [Subtercola sp. RTI3]